MKPPQNPEHKHEGQTHYEGDRCGEPAHNAKQPQRVDWREQLWKLMDENYGYIHQTAHLKVEEFIATVEANARRAVIEEALAVLLKEAKNPIYEKHLHIDTIVDLLTSLKIKNL